jgi:Uncharacterised nucleotidyltransferase
MGRPHNKPDCPEKRLLLCCARTRIEPAIADKIRELAVGPLDWNFLVTQAVENSVTPLFAKNLAAVAGDALEPAHRARLKELMRASAVRSLVFTAELITIMNHFRVDGIQAIPYKGPVLAAQAYGDVTLREFEDLDIVLRQSDMTKANEVLVALGYRPKFPWILTRDAAAAVVPGEYHYRDERRRMIVELHTERTLRHFPVPPDIDDFSRRLVPVSLSGHEVLTFGPEDGLPLLCIHGSKDFWERMSWAADIAEFVQAFPELDWDQSLRCADALHATRMFHLGLAIGVRLFGIFLPAEILGRVRKDSVANTMAQEVERRVLARGSSALGGAGRFGFRRHMLEGSLEGWRYSFRLSVVPAEEDWEMVRLPGPLAPLYIALRPLRLLRKYGVFNESRPPSG